MRTYERDDTVHGEEYVRKADAMAEIAAAVAAERERLAQVVRDFPHWLGAQAKRDLLAAMGFEA